MTPSFSMFLLVVEEMSVSRAAKRAHVTQQCVSDHIRRMEEGYRVRLFYRKPRLSLTPEGQVVYRTVQQVKILEEAMEKNLSEIRADVRGHFSIGINATRARILLPRVLPRYQKILPQVTVSVVLDDTAALQEKLLKGEIDLLVGINAGQDPLFQVERLAQDAVFLAIGKGLLEEYFGQCLNAEKGIDLQEFALVPFVQNLKDSTLASLVSRHCDFLNLSLNTLYFVSDYDIQIALCGMNVAAFFCPESVLERVQRQNEDAGEREKIAIFPIKGLEEKLRVDLITYKNVRQPLYISRFIELVTKYGSSYGT